MHYAMRRQDRELTTEDAQQILAGGTYGVLAINGGAEPAYAVPLSYVYQNDAIYLHCAQEGRKLELIRQNGQASFCVVAEAEPLKDAFSMKYKSAIAFGTVSEISGEEKLPVLEAFIEKYATDEEYLMKGKKYAAQAQDKTTVLKLDIRQLSAKVRK